MQRCKTTFSFKASAILKDMLSLLFVLILNIDHAQRFPGPLPRPCVEVTLILEFMRVFVFGVFAPSSKSSDSVGRKTRCEITRSGKTQTKSIHMCGTV